MAGGMRAGGRAAPLAPHRPAPPGAQRAGAPPRPPRSRLLPPPRLRQLPLPLLLLLLLLLGCSLLVRPAGAKLAMADGSDVWATYHRTDALLAEMQALAEASPGRARYTEARDPTSGERVLPTLTLGRLQLPAKAAKPKVRALFVFGEHPRELISSEIALWLARLLSAGDGSPQRAKYAAWPEAAAARNRSAAARGEGGAGRPLEEWIHELMELIEVKLVPAASLHSRRRVEAGNSCLRLGPGGVDLNRNWPFHWQKILDKRDETYAGPEPLSEPESRALLKLAQDWAPASYVSVHSGEWALYTPWDHSAVATKTAAARSGKGAGDGASAGQPAEGGTAAGGPGAAPGGPGAAAGSIEGHYLPADIGSLQAALNVQCRCQAGPAGLVAEYVAAGTAMDYMFAELRIPYSLTWEVYGPANTGRNPKRYFDFDTGKPSAALKASQVRLSQAKLTVGSASTKTVVVRNKVSAASKAAADAKREARLAARNGTPGAGAAAAAAATGGGQGKATAASTAREAAAEQATTGAAAAEATEAAAADATGDAAAARPERTEVLRRLLKGEEKGEEGTGGGTEAPPQVSGAADEAEAAASDTAAAQVDAPADADANDDANAVADADADAALAPPPPALAPAAPSDPNSCFTDFNPPTPAQYREVIATWVETFLLLLDHLATHVEPSVRPQQAEGPPEGAEGPPGTGAVTGLKGVVTAAAKGGKVGLGAAAEGAAGANSRGPLAEGVDSAGSEGSDASSAAPPPPKPPLNHYLTLFLLLLAIGGGGLTAAVWRWRARALAAGAGWRQTRPKLRGWLLAVLAMHSHHAGEGPGAARRAEV